MPCPARPERTAGRGGTELAATTVRSSGSEPERPRTRAGSGPPWRAWTRPSGGVRPQGPPARSPARAPAAAAIRRCGTALAASGSSTLRWPPGVCLWGGGAATRLPRPQVARRHGSVVRVTKGRAEAVARLLERAAPSRWLRLRVDKVPATVPRRPTPERASPSRCLLLDPPRSAVRCRTCRLKQTCRFAAAALHGPPSSGPAKRFGRSAPSRCRLVFASSPAFVFEILPLAVELPLE